MKLVSALFFFPLLFASANANKDPNVVCTACNDEDDKKGVSQGCFDAIQSYDPDTEPQYKALCTATEASEVSILCKAAVGAYFESKCSNDKSLCEKCAGAEACFEPTACSFFDEGGKKWTGAYEPCNNSRICQDCYPKLSDFPDTCDTGNDTGNAICKSCASEDFTKEGVSEKCFSAVGNYLALATPEPKFAEPCNGVTEPETVSVKCQTAVADYFDCLDSSGDSPSNGFAMLIPGVVLSVMAAMLA